MRRLTLVLALAALAAFALTAFTTASPARSAYRSGGAPPHLTAVSTADGAIHATWTVPQGEMMEEFLYDPSGTTAPTAGLGSDNSCALDSWCWPGNGVPLYCYFPLYHDRTGDCVGHEDIGNTQESLDTDPLTVGKTYYVQVSSMDQCVGESAPCPWPYEYYSNVVPVKITKSSKPGGSSGGSAGSGSGGHASGTARVSFAKTVTVTRADGATVQVKSTVLLPGDVVRSFGSPTHIAIPNGRLVLDRSSQIEYAGSNPTQTWQVKSGEAYYQGTTGRHIRNLLNGAFTETMVCCNAGAVVSVGPGGDTIAVVSPGVGADPAGPVLVMQRGSARNGTPLRPGQQVTVHGATFSTPKRFVPTRFFWR